MTKSGARRRMPPLPVLIIIGCFISFFGYIEQLREFAYLINRSSYGVETLTVLGRGEAYRSSGKSRVRVRTITGRIGNDVIAVNEDALATARSWGPVDHAMEQRVRVGDTIEVLVCHGCDFPVWNIDANVLSREKYGNVGWLTFLITLLKWNAFTIGSVVYYLWWRRAMLRRYQNKGAC
jgi:hypothetical protein